MALGETQGTAESGRHPGMVRLLGRAMTVALGCTVLAFPSVARAVGEDLIIDEPPVAGQWELLYDAPAFDLYRLANPDSPLQPPDLDGWARVWQSGEETITVILIEATFPTAAESFVRDAAGAPGPSSIHEVGGIPKVFLTSAADTAPHVRAISGRGRHVVTVELTGDLSDTRLGTILSAQMAEIPPGIVIDPSPTPPDAEPSGALAMLQYLLVGALGTLVGVVINAVGKRPVVNPWSIGGAVSVGVLVLRIGTLVASAGDSPNLSYALGYTTAGGLIPTLVFVFAARSFERKGNSPADGPDGSGSVLAHPQVQPPPLPPLSDGSVPSSDPVAEPVPPVTFRNEDPWG